jgi:acetyl-CoA synthetase
VSRRTNAGTAQTYAYVPTPDQVRAARVTALMRHLGVGSIDELRSRSAIDPEWFWAAVVDDLDIPFDRPPTSILDDSAGPERARWFVGGDINVATACVDRWRADPATADQLALIAENETGDVRSLSFAELAALIADIAAGLRDLGVRAGDTVGLLLPMIPEAVATAYAVARLGAILVPVFSGYAPSAIAARLDDARCRIVVCADGTRRKGRIDPIKERLDAALLSTRTVERVLVVDNAGLDVPMDDQRDIAWSGVVGRSVEPDRAHPLTSSETPFLLAYAAGTTGAPEGAVHVHGGFTVKVASVAAYSMDIGQGDRLLWVTDMGWIMGVWSMIGAHTQGACLVLLGAAPDRPTPPRLWEIVERHRITHLGVSPTLVRALRAAGAGDPSGHDLSSLRILGSTGEPWNAEAYEWLMHVTGGDRPIINISGGTEVGACLLAPSPVEALKTCSLGGPSLGMAVDVFDESGTSVQGEVGELVCTRPWPGMSRGIWGNDERYLESCWSHFPGVWRHGDRALVDADGQWFLFGRSDDAINVAGKRHPTVAKDADPADPSTADDPASVEVIRTQLHGPDRSSRQGTSNN